MNEDGKATETGPAAKRSTHASLRLYPKYHEPGSQPLGLCNNVQGSVLTYRLRVGVFRLYASRVSTRESLGGHVLRSFGSYGRGRPQPLLHL